MKNKFTRLIPVLLVSLVLVFAISCKKKNVKKIAVDNQFAISLFADSMSMMDVLGMMDSTTAEWLRVKDDGSIWAYYDNKLDGVIKASDLLSNIPDMDIPATTTSFTLPEFEIEGSTTDTVLSVDRFAEFPVNFDGFEISTVKMRRGKLNFGVELSNAIPFLRELTISTNSIIMHDGTPLTIVLDLSGTSSSCEVDLADCEMLPDSLNSVAFSSSVHLDMGSEHSFAGGDYTCTIYGGIKDVMFKTVYGTISKPLDTIFENSLEINFGINGVDGDLFLPVPTVNLIYRNTFGFGTECNIQQLRLVKSNGDYTNLLGEGIDSVLVDVYPTNGDTIYSPIEGFVDEVDIMEHYTSFDFKGQINMLFDEQGQVSVSDTSTIDVVGNVEMPLAFKITDLKYCDTLDFSLNEDLPENNYFDRLDFYIDNDSKIKVNLNLQVLFLDENDQVTDSLFDAHHTINYNDPGTIVSIVTNEKIDHIMSSSQIVMKIGLSTDEISEEPVQFYITDRLALRVRLLTHSSEISLE